MAMKPFDPSKHRMATDAERAAILKVRGYTESAAGLERGIAETERVRDERVKLCDACKAALPVTKIRDMGPDDLAAVLRYKERLDSVKAFEGTLAQTRAALEDIRTLEADAMTALPAGEWFENGGNFYTDK